MNDQEIFLRVLLDTQYPIATPRVLRSSRETDFPAMRSHVLSAPVRMTVGSDSL